jgi:hypothetical protein
MTLLGEAEHPDKCEDCGKELVLEVLHSAAGYYIGTFCKCGPYSRESVYYKTEKAAQEALDKDAFYRP